MKEEFPGWFGKQIHQRHVDNDPVKQRLIFSCTDQRQYFDMNEDEMKTVMDCSNMSADVARGHGGDGGGDDRPPPYQGVAIALPFLAPNVAGAEGGACGKDSGHPAARATRSYLWQEGCSQRKILWFPEERGLMTLERSVGVSPRTFSETGFARTWHGHSSHLRGESSTSTDIARLTKEGEAVTKQVNSGSGGCGDDEPGDDEDGGEDEDGR
ncbi:hypothetical protein Tco_0568304 [Tanacetum coccineum]